MLRLSLKMVQWVFQQLFINGVLQEAGSEIENWIQGSDQGSPWSQHPWKVEDGRRIEEGEGGLWCPLRGGLSPARSSVCGTTRKSHSMLSKRVGSSRTCCDQLLEAGPPPERVWHWASALLRRDSPQGGPTADVVCCKPPPAAAGCEALFLNEGLYTLLQCPLCHYCLEDYARWKYYLLQRLRSIFPEHLFGLDSRLDAQRRDAREQKHPHC